MLYEFSYSTGFNRMKITHPHEHPTHTHPKSTPTLTQKDKTGQDKTPILFIAHD